MYPWFPILVIQNEPKILFDNPIGLNDILKYWPKYPEINKTIFKIKVGRIDKTFDCL